MSRQAADLAKDYGWEKIAARMVDLYEVVLG